MAKKRYVKISVDMFENRKLKLIENMSNRDLIEIIWMRLLVEATKLNDGGLIYLEEDMPYSMEMLSIVLNRSEEDVTLALKVLKDLKMIEVSKDNLIKIVSWSNHQESKRKKKEEEVKVEKETKDTKVEEIKDEEEAPEVTYDDGEIKDEVNGQLEEITFNRDRTQEDIQKSKEVNSAASNITPIKQKRKRRKKKGVEDAEIYSYYEEEEGDQCFFDGDYQPPGAVVKSFTFD